MTNNRNLIRRQKAQEVVHTHVNKRRGEGSLFDWNFVHVIHLQSLEEGSWEAFVKVQGMNQKVFQVIYDRPSDELKVDTFERKVVSRFY